MRTVFALASGRSGTRFLAGLFRRNVSRDCLVRHEPYLDPGNPTLFGRPIEDHVRGDHEAIRRLLRKKKRAIQRHAPRTYVETSHAFLKSWYDLAPEFFPDLKLVHLIRDPLRTAASEAQRERLIHRVLLPLRNYRGSDGRRYFRWALTGREPIFAAYRNLDLGLFQRYVVQWIEIENRAMDFLDRFDKHGDCFTLHCPEDLNDPERVGALFAFLGLEPAGGRVVIEGSKNVIPFFPTRVTDGHHELLRRVVGATPPRFLEIFDREPYCSAPWIERLRS
ncbi:MAG: hypothetical protein ACE10D_13505 [Planctomycetota bacterium]|nr:hypothetical protein [Planctomycetota bacterium]